MESMDEFKERLNEEAKEIKERTQAQLHSPATSPEEADRLTKKLGFIQACIDRHKRE